jgi:hypothetical protein
MRKAFVLAAATAAVVVTGLATTPAQAQSVTFSLTGSSLSIAEPGTTATLTGGSLLGVAGSSITGSLGATTVTDQRGSLLGWTSKVTGTTAFTNGSTTIPVTAAKVWVPAGGITTTGIVVASQGLYLLEASGLALTSSAQTLVTGAAAVGNNSATFTPQIAVTIPSNATAGDYSGVVTQTVS